MDTKGIDLSKYPHKFTREVYLYETDAFGHFNNVSFLAWMESARFDLFKKLEFIDPSDVFSLGLILARVECNYRDIVRYNDTITIHTRVIDIGSSSFTLENVFVREGDQAVVADGKAVLVSFDHQANKPRPLSLKQKERLREYL